MTSLQTKLAITALTNAIARLAKRDAHWPSTYLRLRLNGRDFVWRSPEIGYLDASSHARFVQRQSMGTEGESIVTLALQLTKNHLSLSAEINPATMNFELEAVEIGGRWCVNIKATNAEPVAGRKPVWLYQCRVLSGETAPMVLAT